MGVKPTADNCFSDFLSKNKFYCLKVYSFFNWFHHLDVCLPESSKTIFHPPTTEGTELVYWNWVLDWVTFIYIEKKSEDTTSKVPMNWNWVLDWVISDGSWTK